MDWLAEYRRKTLPACEAVRCIQSNMRVYIHPGCAEPEELVGALMARAPFVKNVEIVHLLTVGRADYGAPPGGRSFPSQCHVHRCQCSSGDQRGSRRLHARLPES